MYTSQIWVIYRDDNYRRSMARSLLHTSQASVTSMQKTTLPSVTLEQTSWSALVRVSFEFRSFSQKYNSGSLRTRSWCRSGDARCCSTSSWCRQAWKKIKTLFCKFNAHLEILWSVLAVSQFFVHNSVPQLSCLRALCHSWKSKVWEHFKSWKAGMYVRYVPCFCCQKLFLLTVEFFGCRETNFFGFEQKTD